MVNKQKMIAGIMIILLILMVPVSGFSLFFKDTGQKPIFDLIDRESGLSNLSVSSIVEDKHGFLWFGTQGGLNRFDGITMEVFRNDPFQEDGLVHNLIQTMYYDPERHEIWIGTYQGISRYSIEENTYINYKPGETTLSHPVIVAIAKDRDGYVWAGTLQGMNRIDPESHEIKNYEIPGHVIRSILLDSNQRLWAGSYEGLLYYDREQDQFSVFELELPQPFVMTVKEFTPGELTLGLWDGGVVKVDPESREMDMITFEDNRIYTITQTRDGVLWAGSWGGGLFALDKNKVHHFSPQSAEQRLAHGVAYSLHQDRSGILWIGTNGGGINKVNPRKVNYTIHKHQTDHPGSLSLGKINALLRDADDHLWVAVYNEGIERYDSQSGNFVKYKASPGIPGSLPSNTVTSMILINGQMVLGTAAGIVSYDPLTDSFNQWPVLTDQNVYALVYDKDRDVLWIGTYQNGVYQYHLQTNDLVNYSTTTPGDLALSDNLIYALLLDQQGRLWIGTNNGLNRLCSDQNTIEQFFRNPGDFSSLASNNIRALMQDSQGQIWIGSVGGGVSAYLEEENAFTTYTESDGLASNVIVNLLEGADGRIWTGTHDGLSIINTDTGHIDILTPADGIGGWEFSPGHFRNSDGTLLLGGVHGIISISSDFSSLQSDIPPMYITRVSIFDTPVISDRRIFNNNEFSFAHDQNFVSFAFTALEFDAPDKVQYRYRLQGFEQDWVDAANRNFVSYSNLDPGNYIFEVYAETLRGVQTDYAQVRFTIKKAWYQSYPAYLALILFFASIFYGAFKLWAARLLQQRNKELGSLNMKLEAANTELENLSVRDPLTGLYNRRYFDQRLDELIHLARRSNSCISLGLIDIDNFKRFNDEYGHIAGDYLLIDLANQMKESLPRHTDFIARYGGDEFVAVLYDTDQPGAEKVFERIRDRAGKVTVRDQETRVPEYVSISIGAISKVPDTDTDKKGLVNSADQALYQAKTSGKNQLYISQS